MRQTTCFISSTAPLTSRSILLPRTGLGTLCTRPVFHSIAPPQQQRRAKISMGLFGLGFPELLVIAVVGVFVFGPSKIAELGKDLGGVAGGVKKATADFKDAMEESLEEADREIEKKKIEKEAASGKTVEAEAKPVDDEKIENEAVAGKPVEVVAKPTEDSAGSGTR